MVLMCDEAKNSDYTRSCRVDLGQGFYIRYVLTLIFCGVSRKLNPIAAKPDAHDFIVFIIAEVYTFLLKY